MIDFFKINIPAGTAKKLENSLDFQLMVSDKTGDIGETKVAKNEGLKFKFSPKEKLVSGSIHKYYHQGENHLPFSFQQFLEAVDRLCVSYGIEPHQARLVNLEFGLNLPDLPIPTKEIISSCIAHKGTSFNKMKRRYNDRAEGVEACHQQYILKIYDKEKQYNLPYPLLRVELKYTRMSPLNKKGIYYLSELCQVENLPVLRELLLSRFKEIAMNEPQLPLDKLISSERLEIANYQNPFWWEDLRQRTSRSYVGTKRKEYRAIISRYVPVTTQQIILNAMQKKWDELALVEAKEVDVLTHFPKHNGLRFNTLCTMLERQPRKCIVTGIDISNQRPGSRFISAKKIGYYEAHNVRNADSNPRNNLRRRINRYKDQPTLFPVNKYLKLSDDQKKILDFWNGTSYEIKVA